MLKVNFQYFVKRQQFKIYFFVFKIIFTILSQFLIIDCFIVQKDYSLFIQFAGIYIQVQTDTLSTYSKTYKMPKGRPKASKSQQKHYSENKNYQNNNKKANKRNKQTIRKREEDNQESNQHQEAYDIKQEKQNKQTNRQKNKNSNRGNSNKGKTKLGSKQVKKVDRVNNFSPRVTRSTQKKSNKNSKSSKNKRDKSLQKVNQNKSKQKHKNNSKMKKLSSNIKQTGYQKKNKQIQTANKYVAKQKKKRNQNLQSQSIKSDSSRSIIKNQRSAYFIRSVRNIKSQTKSMYVDSQQVKLEEFLTNDKKKYGNNSILKSNSNDEQYFGNEQNDRDENFQRQLNQSIRKIEQKMNRKKYIKQKSKNKNKNRKKKPKIVQKKYLSFFHQLVDMMFNPENYYSISQFPKAQYLQSKRYLAQLYRQSNNEDVNIPPDYRQLFDYTYQYEQILMKKQDIIRRMQSRQIIPMLMPRHLKQQQQILQQLTTLINYDQQKKRQKPVLSLQNNSDDYYSDTSSVLFQQIRFKQDIVPYYERGAKILFNELIYKPQQLQQLYSLNRFNNNTVLVFEQLDRHYYRSMDEFNLYFSHCLQIDNQYGRVLQKCYSFVFPQLNDIYCFNLNSQSDDNQQGQQGQQIDINNQNSFQDQQEFFDYDQSLEDSRYWNQKQRDQNIKKKHIKLLKIANQEFQIMKFSDLQKWFVPFFKQLPQYAKKALNTYYPNQIQGQPNTLWHHLHLSRINKLQSDNQNQNSQLNDTGQYSNANSIFQKIKTKFKQPVYRDKYIKKKQHKPQKRDFMISDELSNISRTKSMGKYSDEDRKETDWIIDYDI